MRCLLVLSLLPLLSDAFECYSCNANKGDEHNKGCSQTVEKCPEGVDSCSMVASSVDGSVHVRKFCTAPGTPIYKYLLFFPGSSLCQNINTSGPIAPSPQSLERRRRLRREAGPPAPPMARSNSLLCVCTKPLCNDGSYMDVLHNTMLSSLPKPSDLTHPRKTHLLIDGDFV